MWLLSRCLVSLSFVVVFCCCLISPSRLAASSDRLVISPPCLVSLSRLSSCLALLSAALSESVARCFSCRCSGGLFSLLSCLVASSLLLVCLSCALFACRWSLMRVVALQVVAVHQANQDCQVSRIKIAKSRGYQDPKHSRVSNSCMLITGSLD